MFKLYIYGALAIALVAAAGGIYLKGRTDGTGSERVRWEIKIHNMRTAMAVQKHKAEVAGRAKEEKYLKAEREKSKLRQTKDRDLVNLMRIIPTQPESKPNETGTCPSTPICRPYDMLAYPSILRNIKER